MCIRDSAEVTPTECTGTATTVTGVPFFQFSEDFETNFFGVGGPDTQLQMEFFAGVLSGPGDYELGSNEDDQNYGTCSTCALLTIGEQAFFATSGTITVTEVDQVGEVLQAELKDATFIEVEIPGIAEQDYTSVPVPNGETRCLASSSLEIACLADAVCGDSALCGLDGPSKLGCVDSVDVCTGDDAFENDDDLMSGANAITLGTAISAATCGGMGTGAAFERDWFTFTLAAETSLNFNLAWDDETVDFDVYIVDAELNTIGAGATIDMPESGQVLKVAAGTYYALVVPYEHAGTVAVDYTLTLSVFVPECEESADCTDSAKPACDLETLTCVACVSDDECGGATPACDLGTMTCVACVSDLQCTAANPVCVAGETAAANACGVVDACTGDDANENGDDGINGAQAITLPANITQKICGAPETDSAGEADWFKVTLAAETDVTFGLSWVGETYDFDFGVLDAEGNVVADGATVDNPESTVLSVTGDVAAGEYFIVVYSYEGPEAAATDYTLTVTSAPIAP